jgi:hypothetical protein
MIASDKSFSGLFAHMECIRNQGGGRYTVNIQRVMVSPANKWPEGVDGFFEEG